MDRLQKTEDESVHTTEISELLRVTSKEEIFKGRIMESKEGSSTTISSSLDFIISSASEMSEGSLFLSTTKTTISTKEADETESLRSERLANKCIHGNASSLHSELRRDNSSLHLQNTVYMSSHIQSIFSKSDSPMGKPGSDASIRTYSIENPFESRSIPHSNPSLKGDTITECSYSRAYLKIAESKEASSTSSGSQDFRKEGKSVDKKQVSNTSKEISKPSSVLFNNSMKQLNNSKTDNVKLVMEPVHISSSLSDSCKLIMNETSATGSDLNISIQELYSKQFTDSEDFIAPTPPRCCKSPVGNRKSKEILMKTGMGKRSEPIPTRPIVELSIGDKKKVNRSEGHIKQYAVTSEGSLPSRTATAKCIVSRNRPKFKSHGDIRNPVLLGSSRKVMKRDDNKKEELENILESKESPEAKKRENTKITSSKGSKPKESIKYPSRVSSSSKGSTISTSHYLFRVKMCPSGDVQGLNMESPKTSALAPLTVKTETVNENVWTELSVSQSEQKKLQGNTKCESSAPLPKPKTLHVSKKKRVQKLSSESSTFYPLSKPSDIFMFHDPPYVCPKPRKINRFETDSTSSEDSMSFEYSEDSSQDTETSNKYDSSKMLDLVKDSQRAFEETKCGAYHLQLEHRGENQAKCIQVIFGDLEKTIEAITPKEKVEINEATSVKLEDEGTKEGEKEGDEEDDDSCTTCTTCTMSTKREIFSVEKKIEEILPHVKKEEDNLLIHKENVHSISVGTSESKDETIVSKEKNDSGQEDQMKVVEKNEPPKKNADEAPSEISTPRSTPSDVGCVVNVVIKKKDIPKDTVAKKREKGVIHKKSTGKECGYKNICRTTSAKKRVKIVARKEALRRDAGLENASALLKKITLDLQNQLMLAQYLQDVHLTKKGILKKVQENKPKKDQTTTMDSFFWSTGFDEVRKTLKKDSDPGNAVQEVQEAPDRRRSRKRQPGCAVRSLYSSLGKMLLAKLSGRQLNTMSPEPGVYAVAATEPNTTTTIRTSSAGSVMSEKMHPAPPPSPSFSHSDTEQDKALKSSKMEVRQPIRRNRPSHPPARRKRSKASKSRYTMHDKSATNLRPSSAPYNKSASSTVVPKSRSQSQPPTRTSSVAIIRHDDRTDHKTDKKSPPRSVSEPRRQPSSTDSHRDLTSKPSSTSVRSWEVTSGLDKTTADSDDHIAQRDSPPQRLQMESQTRARQSSSRGAKKSVRLRGSAIHSRRSARPKTARNIESFRKEKKSVSTNTPREEAPPRREGSPTKQPPSGRSRAGERKSVRRSMGSQVRGSSERKSQGSGSLQGAKAQPRESSPTREIRGKSVRKHSPDAAKRLTARQGPRKSSRSGNNKQGNTNEVKDTRKSGKGKGSRGIDERRSRRTEKERVNRKSVGRRGSRRSGGSRASRRTEGGRPTRRTEGGKTNPNQRVGRGSKNTDKDSQRTGSARDSPKLDAARESRRIEGGREKMDIGRSSRKIDGERESRRTEGEGRKIEDERDSRKVDGERESRRTEAERFSRKAEAERESQRAEAEREGRRTEVERESRRSEAERDSRRTEAERESRKYEGGRESRRTEGARSNQRPEPGRDNRITEVGRDSRRSEGDRDSRRSGTGRDSRRSEGGRDSRRSEGGRDSRRSEGGRDSRRSEGGRDSRRSEGGRDSRRSEGGRDSRRSGGGRDSRRSRGRRGSDGGRDRRGSDGSRRGSDGSRRGSDGSRRGSDGGRRRSTGGRRGSDGSKRGSDAGRRGSTGRRDSRKSGGGRDSQSSQGESDGNSKVGAQPRVVDNITRPSIRTIYVQGACSRVAFKAGGMLYPVNLLGHSNPCAPICCNPCYVNCDVWDTQPKHMFAKRPPIDFFRSDTIDFPNDRPIVAIPRSKLMPKSKVLQAAETRRPPTRKRAPPPETEEEEEETGAEDSAAPDTAYRASEPATAASEQPFTEDESEGEEESDEETLAEGGEEAEEEEEEETDEEEDVGEEGEEESEGEEGAEAKPMSAVEDEEEEE